MKKLLPLFALAACAGATPQALLSPGQSKVDFGTVDVGSTGDHSVVLTNSSSSASKVIELTVLGEGFSASAPCKGGPLAAGETCEIAVTFAPTAFGKREGTLTATAGGSPLGSVALSGVGRDFVALQIETQGNGAGQVKADGGLLATYPRTDSIVSVTLHAAPDVSSLFDGWGGDCTGTGACTLLMDRPHAAQAGFTLRRFTLSLEVSAQGGGAGSISGAGLSCAGPCTQQVTLDYGTAVVLAATLSSSLVHWTGPCKGSGASCAFSLTSDAAIGAIFSGLNYLFVTSTPVHDNQGVSAADQACAARAADAGLPGHYVAWVSTSAENASSRLAGARGWMRVDGKPVADSVTALTALHQIFYPPRLDESGADVGRATVQTGTAPDGHVRADANCNDFHGGGSKVDGLAPMGAGEWTVFAEEPCGTPEPVYCFGTDLANAVVIEPAAGRRAFVTAANYRGDLGLAGADAACAGEAGDAGLTGTFKAFLATTGHSAASRFDLLGSPWVRMDGLLLSSDVAGLLSSDLEVPLATHADGSPADEEVWTGAETPTSPGSDVTDCNGWTTADAAASGVYGLSAAAQWDSFDTHELLLACNFDRSFYCLEQ